MTYEEYLNKLSHFSMDDFIAISKKLLPVQYCQQPWLHINHGINLLTNEDQLCAYIAAYGEMHHIKCKASFQNFDFKSLDTTIEVIDWGCGQGIGSFTLIDMLREREKLQLLKKVTLIEPSTVALRRATSNIQKATNGTIQVLPINKYLPGDGTTDEITGLEYKQKNIIHIFSNILDIQSVNLEKLAYIVSTPGHIHHIMCMGPKNTNSYRIDKFCSVFNVKDDAYLSKIDNACYSRTTDTNYNFSCVTRCFTYSGEGINLSKMSQFVEPTLICGRPIHDDYDPLLAVQNNLISKDLANFYAYLGQKLNQNDHIYLKPTINGDTPDIVILRPGTGIMVIKIFEEDINKCLFYETEDKSIIHTSNTKAQSSPINIVQTYQQNLIQLHIKEMLGNSLIDTSYWSVIKTLVYFSKNDTATIKERFKNTSHTTILGKDILNYPNFDILKETRFNYRSRYFDNSICNSFLKVISPKWHSHRQGVHINLTPLQERLVKSEAATMRKINGVAGSGKTQVLATRAVNANLRTGNKVLVLTYNLSLVNYIRYRIGQVKADFSWDMFFVVNYHQLFIAEANNQGLKMNLSSFEDTSFFDGVAKRIKKYSTILIDEVQDYQTEWLSILHKYFLEPNGEFVVFGDAKQNIYQRKLDKNGQIKIGLIPGEWNNSLNTGFRFNNPQLSTLAINFQNSFFPKLTTDNIQQEAVLEFDTRVKYFYVGKTVKAKKLDENCRWLMQEHHIKPQDVVILSQTCDLLRDIDYAYRQSTHLNTMTTFESKEQYDKLKEIYNITDKTSPITYKFRNDIKQIRRNKKIHFYMDANVIKLSTIHSYKGWESPTVILILEQERKENDTQYSVRPEENASELIYTAITRCKENLFVINRGNEKYHHFFNHFCNQ